MFTGLVTDVGTVVAVEERGESLRRLRIRTAYDPRGIALGASIACSGPCLTVVDRGRGEEGGWFEVDAAAETLKRTTLRAWTMGTRINLERSLKVGDELGGHIVTGHVDGVGEVLGICPEGDSRRIGFAISHELAPYLAAKGSITIDGVSLTVNEVTDQPDGSCHFAVNIIPHTAEVTTLGALKQGDKVNLEIDVLARYLQRMQSLRG